MDKHQLHKLDRRKRKNFSCCNCGEENHSFRECSEPITSFGIIAFRRNNKYIDKGPLIRHPIIKCTPPHAEDDDAHAISALFPNSSPLLYLLVQRKDTMGFIDFVRGKYPESGEDPTPSAFGEDLTPSELGLGAKSSTFGKEQKNMIDIYLGEMTCEERQRLRTWSFDKIWNNMWVNHSSKIYINDYLPAKEKFKKLKINQLLDNSTCNWTSSEYSFAKGRKNIRETNFGCAVREFREETGYRNNEFNVISNDTLVENFVGTNGVRYRHIYYIAEVLPHAGPPRINTEDVHQIGEIKNVGWFTYEQCQKIIRPYDIEKKKILKKLHDSLLSLNLI